jgi:hypothetical protein
MNRMFRLVAALAFLLTLAVGAVAQTTLAPTTPITFSATVTDIDYTGRLVTVRGSQGQVNTFEIPASVTTEQLNSIRVGDVITVTYSDAISVRRKPADEAAVDTVDPATRVRTATVTVTAIDRTARSITFTGPRGRSFVRRLSSTADARILSDVSVGDRVDVSWYETMTITKARAVDEEDSLRHRLTASFLWGPDNAFSGKVIKAGSGTVTGVPVNLQETSYDDIFGRVGLFKIGVGYRISPRSEVTLNYVYAKSDSEVTRIGTLGDANAPLSAKFDSYQYWGFEAGQRFYFARQRFTPFLGYYIGLNRFSDMNANFSAPSGQTPSGGVQPALDLDGQFFDASWAFSLGPTGGVLVGVGPIEVMGQVELRFIGGLSDVDPLNDPGLSDVNSESSRWSLPFLFGARFRF